MRIYKVAYAPEFSGELIDALKEGYRPEIGDPEVYEPELRKGLFDILAIDRLLQSGVGTEKDMELYKELEKEDVIYLDVE